MAESIKELKGSTVLIWFVAFFGIITLVNSVFIYTALHTHSGLVTENPYEEGLAYNERLDDIRHQPALDAHMSYEEGVFFWQVRDETGAPLDNAEVSAIVTRPVQSHNNYELALTPSGNGVYTTALDLPYKGNWKVELNAKWDNQHYQKTYRFTAK